MSVTGGFAAMHAVEGAAFLHDALMRKRAVKKAAGKKKRHARGGGERPHRFPTTARRAYHAGF